jgi:hypothetical protein
MAPFPFRPHALISKLRTSNFLFPLTCRKSNKLIDLAQLSQKVLPLFDTVGILGIRGQKSEVRGRRTDDRVYIHLLDSDLEMIGLYDPCLMPKPGALRLRSKRQLRIA